MRPGHDAVGRGGSQAQGQGEVSMYQFSRAMYRELAKDVDTSVCEEAHHHVLRACEQNIERLVGDRHYFARPARTLFKRHPPLLPDDRAAARLDASCSATSPAPRSGWTSCPRTASTSTASRCSAARRRAAAPPASGCRCRTTATARRTSTSPRPRRSTCRGHRRLRRRPSLEAARGRGPLRVGAARVRTSPAPAPIAWRADAAGGRRRRDLHRRRAGRRRAADHGQGADDAASDQSRGVLAAVARGAGGRGRARRRRRRWPSPTG